MAPLTFIDADNTQNVGVVSVRSSVSLPNLHVDNQLLQQTAFLEFKPNNHFYVPGMPSKAPIVTEILNRHPLLPALTRQSDVPMLYVQQFWRTLQFHADVGNQHFTARVDHFTLSFGLNKFREILGFPQANSRPEAQHFEEFDTEEIVLATVRAIGYDEALPRISSFSKSNLPPTYNTLFTILNRCLTGKNSGVDSATRPMLTLFQGVLLNKHYDYASLVFSDLVEMATSKKRQSMTYLPFIRFFGLLIRSAINRNLEIPSRAAHPMAPITPMNSMRYPSKVFPAERPLQASLVAYVDQSVSSVREYRNLHALMVQPESAGPAHNANPISEGIAARDSESGIQGRGALRENVIERGSIGGATDDQLAHSHSVNVVAEIGQISSAIQMDDIFQEAVQQLQEVEQPAVNSPVHSTSEMVDYDTSSADETVPIIAESVELVNQRLHETFGSSATPANTEVVASEATNVDSTAATEVIAQESDDDEGISKPSYEGHGATGVDENDDDDDDTYPGDALAGQLLIGDIRMVEGELVENANVSSSEGGAKEHGEGLSASNLESSRVPTSAGDDNLLPSTIELDMVDPTMHSTTPPSHSIISQQMVVSLTNGDLAQLVPTTQL